MRVQVLGLAFLLNVFYPLMSFARPSASPLLESITQLNLSSSLEWKRLLFYNKGTWKGEVGIIDAPSFYLSAEGKFDAQKELEATIAAFFKEQDPQEPDLHALCLFPARAAWLKRQFPSSTALWPEVSCPRLEAWLRGRSYSGMSIIFSSFYPDNPASMFGHTFLRLHRPKTSTHQSDILDDIVNFAAYPTTQNPLLYGLMGATGGFPGRFSIMPYYMKIQEYTNLESRDLWEYELKASPEEVGRIVLSLWEFGPHHADYFYFDENCSYLLLVLMETGNAEWDLSSRLPLWVTPTSSLQIAIQGIAYQNVEFRASALSRYRERFDALTAEEQQVLADLLSARKPRSKDDSVKDWRQEIKVIDAALEYFDFTEKLGGNNTAKKYASLRNEALTARSQSSLAPSKLAQIPWIQNPLTARSESWYMLSAAQIGQDPRMRLRFQPVLHDLLNNPSGYSEGMEIQLMPMQFDFNPSQIFLSQLDLLRIVSITPSHRLLTPSTWALSLGWRKEELCIKQNSIDLCSQFGLAVGRGLATQWDVDHFGRWTLAGFLRGQLGSLSRETNDGFLDLGPELRAILALHSSVRLDLRTFLAQRWFDKEQEVHFHSEGALAIEVNQRSDVRLQYSARQVRSPLAEPSQHREFSAGLLTYF